MCSFPDASMSLVACCEMQPVLCITDSNFFCQQVSIVDPDHFAGTVLSSNCELMHASAYR